MREVFVVIRGSYGEQDTQAVRSTPELANKFIDDHIAERMQDVHLVGSAREEYERSERDLFYVERWELDGEYVGRLIY